MITKKSLHHFFAVSLVAMAAATSAHAEKWQVTELGAVGAQSWLFLNNSGQVAGTAAPGPNGEGFKTAFVTGPNGTNRRNVYNDTSLESVAISINDAGMLLTTVGSDEDWTQQVSDSNSTSPVFTSIARSMYHYSYGDLNNTGKVIGQGANLNVGMPGYAPYIANQDGTNHEPLGNGTPLRITDNNVVLYNDFFTSTGYGPAISGPNAQGATLIQKPSGAFFNHAYGMSDLGHVVGEIRYADNMPRAFMTGPDGVGLIEIGTLGQPLSYALGVNNKGEVVGSYGDNFELWHAMITGPNGQNPRDLAAEVTLPNGGFLTSAIAINESGQVAAIDYYNKKAYLLTPMLAAVPEPSTISLMCMGLLGLAAGRRNKTSRKAA